MSRLGSMLQTLFLLLIGLSLWDCGTAVSARQMTKAQLRERQAIAAKRLELRPRDGDTTSPAAHAPAKNITFHNPKARGDLTA